MKKRLLCLSILFFVVLPEAEMLDSKTVYKLLKNYDKKAARDAFLKSDKKVYIVQQIPYLFKFDEESGTASFRLAFYRLWKDTTLPLNVPFPKRRFITKAPDNFLWMPPSLLSSEAVRCRFYIRPDQWVLGGCNTDFEKECRQASGYRYPHDRYLCDIFPAINSLSIKPQCLARAVVGTIFTSKKFIPLATTSTNCEFWGDKMKQMYFSRQNLRRPDHWRMINYSHSINGDHLKTRVTVERFHPNYFLSEVLTAVTAGIVIVSVVLFGISPTHRLEMNSVGFLIVIYHFAITQTDRGGRLADFGAGLFFVQGVVLLWSVIACNLQLSVDQLEDVLPSVRTFCLRLLPKCIEETDDQKGPASNWRRIIAILDLMVFAILSFVLIILFLIFLM